MVITTVDGGVKQWGEEAANLRIILWNITAECWKL